jgi:hypothetical protein
LPIDVFTATSMLQCSLAKHVRESRPVRLSRGPILDALIEPPAKVLGAKSWRNVLCPVSEVDPENWTTGGRPEIVNMDQGVQFTSEAWTSRL